MPDVEKSGAGSILGMMHGSTGLFSILCAGLRGCGRYSRRQFDEGEDVAMHEWMIGVGFIALLMTPCFIAMRMGVEDAEDTIEDQEASGVRSARRLKLL